MANFSFAHALTHTDALRCARRYKKAKRLQRVHLARIIEKGENYDLNGQPININTHMYFKNSYNKFSLIYDSNTQELFQAENRKSFLYDLDGSLVLRVLKMIYPS